MHTTPGKKAVRVQTSAKQLSLGYSAKAKVVLRYNPEDPYAVQVRFREPATGKTVRWSFARELLACGLNEPSGTGDVRLWPWNTPKAKVVGLALSSPQGDALFEFRRSVLKRFLRSTFQLVPCGHETDYYDLDKEISRLLPSR